MGEEFSYLHEERQTLETLVSKYGDALVRFAYCYTKNADAAEDIAEDAFVALFLKKKRFLQESQLKAYLYRAVKNRCVDYLRARKRAPASLSDLEAVLAGDDLSRTIEDRCEAQALYRCMQALPPQYGNVLYLSYFEGYSPDEIAALLRQNKKQVYNALARAKTALSKLLKQEGIS